MGAVSALQVIAPSRSHALCQMATCACLPIKKGTHVLAQVQLLFPDFAFDLALMLSHQS